MGRTKGIGWDKLAAIEGFRESDLFSAAEQAALAYTEEMCRIPVEVPDAIFEELARWFDDRAIVELTATVALENLRARFNRALQVPSDNLCILPAAHRASTAAAAGESSPAAK
ncbi:MAG TPA: hypothetical protein VMV27_08820 [Candidatus Binataceae bacterium]|nr:hypothetical protein [Candidatus Binataceae bacterium]